MILLSIHSFGSINVANPCQHGSPIFHQGIFRRNALLCISHGTVSGVSALRLSSPLHTFHIARLHGKCRLVEEVLIALIKRRKALELNTARLDRPENFRIMEWILQQYTRLGGYMVTVGSDAHKLEAIGRNFDRAKQLLNSVGLDHLTVFEDTRPKQLSWTSYSVELREPKS